MGFQGNEPHCMPPQEKSHHAASATVELRSSRRIAMARHTRIAPRKEKGKEAEVKVDKHNRLRVLLWILMTTTAVLIAQQVYRYWHRVPTPPPTPDEQYLPVQFDEQGEMDMGTMERMLDILYKRPNDMEGYESMEAEPGSYRFRKQA